ncbi:TPM domain-containing protein [Chitinophaga filiformis]|uniref:TPM domain-containing protein n=1 Tax=Chitinophaga filiformis TaxID=104663 RepID=A0ABY4HVX6_CHIFI|nr:TPM domain-containing protein [Chitinophaga filiformis]UPK67560.1 TPM domain-containing protein [Chitinophaga filiformis]
MIHLKRYHIYLLLLLFTLACGEKKDTGFTIEKIPDPMQHGAYVSNPDHLVSQETETRLNEQMRQLDQSGRAQVAIILLNTIGDKVPKDVAHDVFRLWKPGQQGKDNGLVVLLVNDQHRIEFETGYGLEGDLPDVICFRIQQSEMLPSFKQNNIDEGMLKGMTALINVLQSATDTINITQVAQAGDAAPSDTEAANAGMDAATGAPQEQTFSDAITSHDVPEHEAPGIGSLILYVLYALFATIFVVRPGIAKRRKDLPQLFKAGIWHKFWVYALPFVVLLILVSIPGSSYHWWMLPVIAYLNLLAYLSYRAFTINKKAAVLLAGLDRHVQYETLNLAHANSWLSSILFPLPLLAYSRWHIMRMNKLRYDPYNCETCHRPMQLLKRGKKREMLEPVQVAEDKVGAVIYDVWYCKKCEEKKVLGYRNLRTDATNCPSCNALTFVAGRRRVITPATTRHEGKGIQLYVCKHCNYTKEETYVIAKLSSGGSSGSSSGSSGSSSSSGGWGGGSSGGGGAGSSW